MSSTASDPRRKSSVSRPPTLALGSKRFGPTSVAINTASSNKVYIFGGYNGTECLDTCDVYDAVANTIVPLSTKMCARRSFASAVHLPALQKIVVFGGFDGSLKLNTAEMLDLTTLTFTPVAKPMVSIRYGACAVALEDGHSALIMGGHDGAKVVQSCERFDGATGTFEAHRSSLSVERCFAAAVNVNGHIVVIGGHNGVSRLKTCDRCDEATQLIFSPWGTREMNSPRSGLAAVADHVSGRIFVLGGTDGKTFWSSCEVLDTSIPNANFAELEGVSMRQNRSGCCASLVTPFYAPAGRQHKSIVVFGGMDGVRTTATFEALTISSCSLPPPVVKTSSSSSSKKPDKDKEKDVAADLPLLAFVYPAVFHGLYASEASERDVLWMAAYSVMSVSMRNAFLAEARDANHRAEVQEQRDLDLDGQVVGRTAIEAAAADAWQHGIVAPAVVSLRDASLCMVRSQAEAYQISFCATGRQLAHDLFEITRAGFLAVAVAWSRDCHSRDDAVFRSTLAAQEAAARVVALDRTFEHAEQREQFFAFALQHDFVRPQMELSSLEALQRLAVEWSCAKIRLTLAHGWTSKIGRLAAEEADALRMAQDVERRKQAARDDVAALHASVSKRLARSSEERAEDSQHAGQGSPALMTSRKGALSSPEKTPTRLESSATGTNTGSNTSWTDIQRARAAASAAFAEHVRHTHAVEDLTSQESVNRGKIAASWAAWQAVVCRSFQELDDAHQAEVAEHKKGQRERIQSEEAARRRELESAEASDTAQRDLHFDQLRRADAAIAAQKKLLKRLKYCLNDEIDTETQARKFWITTERKDREILMNCAGADRLAAVIASRSKPPTVAPQPSSAGQQQYTDGVQVIFEDNDEDDFEAIEFEPDDSDRPSAPANTDGGSGTGGDTFMPPSREDVIRQERQAALDAAYQRLWDRVAFSATTIAEQERRGRHEVTHDATARHKHLLLMASYREDATQLSAIFAQERDNLRVEEQEARFTVFSEKLLKKVLSAETSGRGDVHYTETRAWHTLLYQAEDAANLLETLAARQTMGRHLSSEALQILAPLPPAAPAQEPSARVRPARPLSANIYSSSPRSTPGPSAATAPTNTLCENLLYDEAIARSSVEAAQGGEWARLLSKGMSLHRQTREEQLCERNKRKIVSSSSSSSTPTAGGSGATVLPPIVARLGSSASGGSVQPAQPNGAAAKANVSSEDRGSVEPVATKQPAPPPQRPTSASLHLNRATTPTADAVSVADRSRTRQLVIAPDDPAWWLKVENLRKARAALETKSATCLIQNDDSTTVERKSLSASTVQSLSASTVTGGSYQPFPPTSQRVVSSTAAAPQQLYGRCLFELCDAERAARLRRELDASATARLLHSHFNSSALGTAVRQDLLAEAQEHHERFCHAQQDAWAGLMAQAQAAVHSMVLRRVGAALQQLCGHEASARTYWMLGEHEDRQALRWEESRDKTTALVRKMNRILF